MLDMPIDKMNNPSTTQPTFASVVSAFINCLKTRYTSQILTPNKIIRPRCTKNKIAAVNPAKTIKIFSLKNPLSDLILLVYLLKQRRGTYGSVILLYALSCRKSVLLYGRNKRFCCCGNII